MLKYAVVMLVVFGFLAGCNKDPKENKTGDNNSDKKVLGWKDGVSASDIPDTPLAGNLDGKEVKFQYIVFEKWRGSNDNVIMFSLVKPSQPCGFIESFSGFQLMNKGGDINQGEWVKSKFDDDPKTYQAFFRTEGSDKSAAGWNCALVIESADAKSVKGKIALYFNDSKKSWIAGKFEASLCNN